VHVLVQKRTAQRIDEAAKQMDQSRSAWMRLAIIEKLGRDDTAASGS
jgi:predicted transcriptional regulator